MENAFSLCRIAYQAFQIPVFCYQQGVLFTSYPDDPCIIPPAYIEPQLDATGKPLYFTEFGACFARLIPENAPEFSLLLGPVSTLPYSDAAMLELQRSYGISEQKKEVFCTIMQNTPPMTQLDFFYRLIALYYMVTQKELPLSYFIQTPQQTEVDALHQKQHETVFQQKEYALQNNSFEIEKAMLSIVREGDIAAIKKYLKEIPSYHGGDVASTPLRQQKNYFISTATLISRAAIDGGLSTDDAYSLSDLYITRAESLQSTGSINTLFIQMIIDFTQQVCSAAITRRKILGRDTNRIVFDCRRYIQQHTHQPLTIQTVADALGYNRSYLSSLFAKSTGTQLRVYILECRLAEGKSLLRYTTTSISEISNSLCFSNQSHFTRRFREAYGITPAEYRKGK